MMQTVITVFEKGKVISRNVTAAADDESNSSFNYTKHSKNLNFKRWYRHNFRYITYYDYVFQT